MDRILRAEFTADVRRRGETVCSLRGNPGENLYLGGTPEGCELYFEVLCGLRKPDAGYVAVCGEDIYAMSPERAAAFRSKFMGAIPRDLGWLPELSMLEQIIFPLTLAGENRETIKKRILRLTTGNLPPYDLYNPPGKCNVRKQAQAAMVRAIASEPAVIVMNGCFDDFPEREAERLWQEFQAMRPRDSLLIYLTGGPPPEQIPWTREYRI